MMEFLLNLLWAFQNLAFGYLLFRGSLEVKTKTTEVVLVLFFGWCAMAVYGLFQVEGIYGYLMYLLVLVLMLLYVFDETGVQGLCLLLLALIIPICVDLMARSLTDSLLVISVVKFLPMVFAALLRHFRKTSAGATTGELDNLLLRQHMEMQQESMTALEQNYRMQRKSAHEFEHHLQVLRDLLDREETDAARDYLNRLKKNRSIHVMSVSSNHPVIDVILNQKYQTARENEIKMQIQVNDLSALTVPTDSLVVVLTNLLDNAIEACRRLDGYREIFCSVLYDDGLYISIRNTSEEVTVVDGKIPTSKQDSLSHGFGLMSVTYVLEKLDAEYTFGYDEGWFHFAAEIE